MSRRITVQARVQELTEQHGGINRAARAIGANQGYLSRLRDGYYDNPSPDVVRKLGLRTVYEVRQTADAFINGVPNAHQENRDRL